MMVYDKITDEKHKIKLEACKMKMESTSVWMELDKCYMHDLEVNVNLWYILTLYYFSSLVV